MRVEPLRGGDLRIGVIHFDPHRGHLHFGRGAGLHTPESKMLEDLFDHLLILVETDDLHPPLAFGATQGVHLIDLLGQPRPVFSVLFEYQICNGRPALGP